MKFSILTACYNEEENIVNYFKSLEKLKKGEYELEIIIVDDFSSDNTVNVIKSYLENSSLDVKLVLQSENTGAGIARNNALTEVEGDYLLILDADDQLRSNSLYDLNEVIKENRVDIVSYQYVYRNLEAGTLSYPKQINYELDTLYTGKDSEIILKDDDYYSCNKLYSVSFLRKNNILYGNQRRYEDFIFIMSAYSKAESIYITSKVCSEIHVNPNSVTRNCLDGTEHMDDFIKSLNQIYSTVEFRNNESLYSMSRVLFKKALLYTDKRTNPKYQNELLAEALKIIFENCKEGKSMKLHAAAESSLFNYLLANELYEKKDLRPILKVYANQDAVKKLKANRGFNKSNSKIQKYKAMYEKRTLPAKYIKPTLYSSIELFEQEFEQENKIVIFGFDYEKRGNSKYILEQLNEDNKGYDIVFLPDEGKKYSFEYMYHLATAKFVMIESFVDASFVIRSNAKLIQLWHGTPVKKVGFDSPERTLLKNNPRSRIEKLYNFSKYDYLLVENEFSAEKFKSAFLVDDEKILKCQYPRVTWLLENQNNDNLKNQIKEKLGIKNDKVILYAPTWRDYEIGKNPFLEIEKLALEEEVTIINLMHPYKNQNTDSSEAALSLEERIGKIVKLHSELGNDADVELLAKNMSGMVHYEINKKVTELLTSKNNIQVIDMPEVETQELILISDICISDYSSIIFDFMHMNKDVYLLWKDIEAYEYERGVYSDFKTNFPKENIAIEEEELSRFLNESLKNPGKSLEVAEEFITYQKKLVDLF